MFVPRPKQEGIDKKTSADKSCYNTKIKSLINE